MFTLAQVGSLAVQSAHTMFSSRSSSDLRARPVSIPKSHTTAKSHTTGAKFHPLVSDLFFETWRLRDCCVTTKKGGGGTERLRNHGKPVASTNK